MSNPVIQVEHVSKVYQTGTFRSQTFVEEVQAWLARMQNKPDPRLKVHDTTKNNASELHWALKDIDFEIQQGNSVGIIGKNGAGKSTLLKILSRVTTPTSGRIRVKGRVASLLEVGTGFHPELTGRENIFINGAILGMTKADIASRLDEIIDFSGVEKYIDTPVKRYSSGMYVRLAFAVAAHLEPDILIVDEVLAVGDAEFQKKCLGKMDEVHHKQGRTILFVSHNLSTVKRLCSHGLVLSKGGLATSIVPVDGALQTYYRLQNEAISNTFLFDRQDRKGNGWLRFRSFVIYNEDGVMLLAPQTGSFIKIEIEFITTKDLQNIEFAISINGLGGENKTLLWSQFSDKKYNTEKGIAQCSCIIPKLPLTSGQYSVNLFSKCNGHILDWIEDAVVLDVEDGVYYNTTMQVVYNYNSVLVDHSWQ